MGTFGTAIKDSDAFADVYDEFFELYNKGELPEAISKKVIDENWEMLEIEEEKHSLWFALALAQWETKSLNPEILYKVEKIILSGEDIDIWKNSGASDSDIKKRKIALDKFLEKIKSEQSKAKPRKKTKLKTPIYQVGDCIVFKFENGNYGGAVILASDTNPETACNLVATTRIHQKQKPNITDFENAEILILNFANWEDKPDVTWYFPDLFYKNFSGIYELVGRIKVEIEYDSSNHTGEGYKFKPFWTSGWNMNQSAESQFQSESIKMKPINSLTVKQLTKKDKWWKLF